jgi:hypothetical protein
MVPQWLLVYAVVTILDVMQVLIDDADEIAFANPNALRMRALERDARKVGGCAVSWRLAAPQVGRKATQFGAEPIRTVAEKLVILLKGRASRATP